MKRTPPDCWIERARLASESRTEPHAGPQRTPSSQRATLKRSERGPEPIDKPVPEKTSIEYLAAEFLARVEGEGDYTEDPRALLIANAVSAIDSVPRPIVRYETILGAGSFGTAALLPNGKVLKLTTDPTEVQAGAVLTGKELPHVARIYGAWFVQGAKADAVVGWDAKSEEEIRKSMRIGVLLLETVLNAAYATASGYVERKDLDRISKVVKNEKTRLHVWPNELIKLTRAKVRERLRKASSVIEDELRRQHTEVAEAVADALTELRAESIYAVDVHVGNIGYSETDERFKIFDIGSSSPPAQPKAGVLKKQRRALVEGAAPDVVVNELDGR
jgi:hypothetical protein